MFHIIIISNYYFSLCKSYLEHTIVFSLLQWVGGKEQNRTFGKIYSQIRFFQ